MIIYAYIEESRLCSYFIYTKGQNSLWALLIEQVRAPIVAFQRKVSYFLVKQW